MKGGKFPRIDLDQVDMGHGSGDALRFSCFGMCLSLWFHACRSSDSFPLLSTICFFLNTPKPEMREHDGEKGPYLSTNSHIS